MTLVEVRYLQLFGKTDIPTGILELYAEEEMYRKYTIRLSSTISK